MNKLKIVDMNGQQTIDSRLVAEALEMQHKDLLEKIRNYIKILDGGKFRSQDFFIQDEYKSRQNKIMPCYMLTKKGCEMVANKLTGEKGVIFTAMYVEAFNKMEQQPQLPADPMKALELMFQATKQTNETVNKVENRVTNLEENAFLTPSEYNLVSTRVNERVRHIINVYRLKPNRQQRSELYKAINREIKVITGIKARCQLRQKDLDNVLDFINDWEPSKATLVVVEQLALNFEEGKENGSK
ncbi:MAG: ORF6C domain-containing protein [Coprobacillus cateniformis]|nr:ORF6C domain-containing protein [Coprobacillus cateniformis]